MCLVELTCILFLETAQRIGSSLTAKFCELLGLGGRVDGSLPYSQPVFYGLVIPACWTLSESSGSADPPSPCTYEDPERDSDLPR